MSSFYGFQPEVPIEELILNDRHRVPGNIVQYLALFQLDGIQFLFKNYNKNLNCLLNDDAGLGKLLQCVALLIAICLENKDNKCLIISHNEKKFHHWIYYLSIFSQLEVKEIRETEEHFKEQIFITKSTALSNKINDKKWNITIIDGTSKDKERLTTEELLIIEKICSCCKVFLVSSDIMLNFQYFNDVMGVLKRPELEELPTSELEEKSILFIRSYCRDFCLRRFRHQVDKDLPLIEEEVFQLNFENWRKTNVITPIIEKKVVPKKRKTKMYISSSESENTPQNIQHFKRNSTPNNRDSLTETEKMSSVLFSSDSDNTDLNFSKIAGQWIDENNQSVMIPETLSSQCSVLSSTKYNFTLSTLMPNSDTPNSNKSEELQIISDKKSTPIYVASSNEKKITTAMVQHDIYQGSPDLFASYDEANVTDDDINLNCHDLGQFSQRAVGINSSTPIGKQNSNSSMGNASIVAKSNSSDLFADMSFDETVLPLKQLPSPISQPEKLDNSIKKEIEPPKDDVFEITKNSMFSNVIRVNSEEEMTLLLSDSSLDAVNVSTLTPKKKQDSPLPKTPTNKILQSPSTPRNKKYTKKRNTPNSSSKQSPSSNGWLKKIECTEKSGSSSKRKSWFDETQFDDVKKRRGILRPQQIFPIDRTPNKTNEACIFLFSTDDDDL